MIHVCLFSWTTQINHQKCKPKAIGSFRSEVFNQSEIKIVFYNGLKDFLPNIKDNQK